jgi:hypothetical protein
MPALSRSQRLAVAQLSGLMSRLTRGGLRGLDDDRRQELIAEVTTDPVVLGTVLGAMLVPEMPQWAEECADGARLLRAAGADERVAEAKAQWLRESADRRGRGWIEL